jgi:lipopolysaccharide export system protein LptA
LNNAAIGARSRSSERRITRTPAWLGIAVALLLVGVNGGLTRAQNLSGASPPARNRVSAQQTVRKRERTGRTAATQPAQNRAKKPESKSAPGNSKDQDSETPFGSLANSNRGPISIQSDSLALDYKQNAVLFDGHVRATQADAVLASNRLRVKYGKDFHEVQDMAADGNVHISQGVRWCTSDRAVMDQRQHTVVLTGSPICHDASDQIAGTRITVHLDTGKSDVQAAKAVIFPQQSKTRDNEALADQMK